MRGGLGRGFSGGEIEGRERCGRSFLHCRSGIVSFTYAGGEHKPGVAK